MQLYVIFQDNSTRFILPGRNHHSSPTLLMASVNSRINGRGLYRKRILGSSELKNVIIRRPGCNTDAAKTTVDEYNKCLHIYFISNISL